MAKFFNTVWNRLLIRTGYRVPKLTPEQEAWRIILATTVTRIR